ncbi:hypothetical protein M885DRAFT_520915 [Pelagophyceae sp. CCMP2097]|nr:hypothetical protein M885DRAFT_520915 [Pelagophyceae sp. CCMP2097]
MRVAACVAAVLGAAAAGGAPTGVCRGGKFCKAQEGRLEKCVSSERCGGGGAVAAGAAHAKGAAARAEARADARAVVARAEANVEVLGGNFSSAVVPRRLVDALRSRDLRVFEMGPGDGGVAAGAGAVVFASNPAVFADGRSYLAKVDEYSYCARERGAIDISRHLKHRLPREAQFSVEDLAARTHAVAWFTAAGDLKAFAPCAEDPRALVLDGKRHFTFSRQADRCAAMLAAESNGSPEPWLAAALEPASAGFGSMWLARLEPTYAELPLRWAGAAAGPQKNWVPFSFGNKLFFSYSLCPHVVLKCLRTGACDKAHETTNDACGARFAGAAPKPRGGAPPVAIEGGLLGVAHVTLLHRGRKRFQHLFYKQDDFPPFAVTGFSRPFTFPQLFGGALDRIQFCSGMRFDEDAGNLTLTYGVGDCVARRIDVPLEQALDLFDEEDEGDHFVFEKVDEGPTMDPTMQPGQKPERQ